jgi:hypothetical protein
MTKHKVRVTLSTETEVDIEVEVDDAEPDGDPCDLSREERAKAVRVLMGEVRAGKELNWDVSDVREIET